AQRDGSGRARHRARRRSDIARPRSSRFRAGSRIRLRPVQPRGVAGLGSRTLDRRKPRKAHGVARERRNAANVRARGRAMTRWLRVLGLAFTLFTSWDAHAAQTAMRRFALIIGNNAAEAGAAGSLRYADDDALAM